MKAEQVCLTFKQKKHHLLGEYSQSHDLLQQQCQFNYNYWRVYSYHNLGEIIGWTNLSVYNCKMICTIIISANLQLGVLVVITFQLETAPQFGIADQSQRNFQLPWFLLNEILYMYVNSPLTFISTCISTLSVSLNW